MKQLWHHLVSFHEKNMSKKQHDAMNFLITTME